METLRREANFPELFITSPENTAAHIVTLTLVKSIFTVLLKVFDTVLTQIFNDATSAPTKVSAFHNDSREINTKWPNVV